MMTAIVLFLVLVLGSAATHKLIAQDRLAGATAVLLNTSLPIGHALTLAAAGVEALAALSLVFEATRVHGAVIAGCLWGLYGSLLFAARRRGSALDCGCDFGMKAKPIDRFVLWRASTLVVFAISVGLAPVSQMEIETLFAALGLFSLYLAASEIAAIPSLRRSIAS